YKIVIYSLIFIIVIVSIVIVWILVDGLLEKHNTSFEDVNETTQNNSISSCKDADKDSFKDDSCGGFDCNDKNAAINPNSDEICNQIDDNCDRDVDEGAGTDYYVDGDRDGYGNSSDSVKSCSPMNNSVTKKDDCNDKNATINPGVNETCNGIDDDCDGIIDECTSASQVCISGICTINNTGNNTQSLTSMNGLVSWWRLNGNANDEMGMNNGVVLGAVWNATGRFGGGYEFDGIDDYINMSHKELINRYTLQLAVG
ncbi:MAG: putative metal-binding motif-containing protein, partial [Nanoarchaeota archaeon]